MNKLDVDVVKEMLPSYGYEPQLEDTAGIALALDRVIRRLEDYLNRRDFPPHIIAEAYRMAVGEFLYMKKLTSTLNNPDDTTLKFPDRITQLTEGDSSVSVTMSGKNDEELFMNELDKMRNGDPYILEHYRKVHWF